MNHEVTVWAAVYAAAIERGNTNIVAKAIADQAVNDWNESVRADFAIE